MVFGWIPFGRQQRSNSLSSEDEGRRQSIDEDIQRQQLRRMQSEIQEQAAQKMEGMQVQDKRMQMQDQQNSNMQQQPRRRSLFDIRMPFASDRFSREYADAMDDMWVAECDQGDAGRAGKGLMQGPLFQRRVPLGQDEFSREYFDSMEDMFVAETDHGDSGFLYRNPHQPTFNRIPEALQKMGQNLYRPVKVGSDEFSREYARESQDVWLAQTGKEPSAKLPSALMRRVRLGSDGFSREYADASGDNWLADHQRGDAGYHGHAGLRSNR